MSVKAEELNEESDLPDELNDDEETEKLLSLSATGRTITMQMLLEASILKPGKSAMTIEYLGQRFVGDLLPDGKIKSHEAETIFCSPSAWAIYCKRIINPDKKSGCGWASVKYMGRKLDVYKAQYIRKAQLQRDQKESDCPDSDDKAPMDPPPPPVRRNIVQHNTISNRSIMHDANTLIEAVSFSSVGKMQPFLVTVTSSTLLLIDFHCHVTNNEVCGYLGGTWDINTHNLSITHAFPCRNSRFDRDKAALCELQIQKLMVKKNLNLVGWYHSHPRFPGQPTLRDCDAQLEYQIKMRGQTEASYSPCVGFICSPYDDNNVSMESNIISFWSAPPPENRPMEYPRPMLMSFNLIQDDAVCEEVKEEMTLTVDYYKQFHRELINFSSKYKNEMSFIEKLKTTLVPKFPRGKMDGQLWNFIRELLGLDAEEIPVENIEVKVSDENEKPVDLENGKDEMKMEEDLEADLHAMKEEDKISTIASLQAQLKRPSGLNMTPSPLSSALVLPPSVGGTQNNASSVTTTNTSSPRDSPITIPSNSASPAKFEIPIRASPSPAKSDTSSVRSRNRNSPAPSPGKLSLSDANASNLNSLMANMGANINDLYAATLASLSSSLPPGLLTSDYTSVFGGNSKEYGLSALSSLASAASMSEKGINPKSAAPQAPSATSSSSSSMQQIPNMKEFMSQLEKGNLSLLMQSQYGSLNPPSAAASTPSTSTSKSQGKSRQQSSGRGKSQNSNQNNPIIDYPSLAEFMKSPEYTQMLRQQAETLRGIGSDISIIKKPEKKVSKSSLVNKLRTLFQTDNYLPPLPTVSDISLLMEQSKKVPEIKQILQSANVDDINVLLQAQMLSNNTIDFSVFVDSTDEDSGKKLPDTSSSSLAMNYGLSPQVDILQKLSATTTPSSGKNSKSDKSKSTPVSSMNVSGNPAEMLNSLFTSAVGNMPDMSSLLYGQSKGAADLSSLFGSANPSSTSTATSTSAAAAAKQSLSYLSMFPQLSASKLQEISSLIPDPLSKATLEANNMYLAPSLMKLQQEFNTMMKPPKSSSKIETPPPSTSSTPTKQSNNRDSPIGKYNFNAADLAISSISNPLDMSANLSATNAYKKRSEFSSIADLVAPPAKTPKMSDNSDG